MQNAYYWICAQQTHQCLFPKCTKVKNFNFNSYACHCIVFPFPEIILFVLSPHHFLLLPSLCFLFLIFMMSFLSRDGRATQHMLPHSGAYSWTGDAVQERACQSRPVQRVWSKYEHLTVVSEHCVWTARMIHCIQSQDNGFLKPPEELDNITEWALLLSSDMFVIREDVIYLGHPSSREGYSHLARNVLANLTLIPKR